MAKVKSLSAVKESRVGWEWPEQMFHPEDGRPEAEHQTAILLLVFGCLHRIADSLERQEAILRRMDRRQKDAAAKKRSRA